MEETIADDQPFVYFTSLPMDLQATLLNHYVDPAVSLVFFRVSSRYNYDSNPKIDRYGIIRRLLVKRSFDRDQSVVARLSHCSKCFALFDSYVNTKAVVRMHDSKHLKYEKKGKKWTHWNPKPKSCEACGAAYANLRHHECLLKTTYCGIARLGRVYEWLDSRCERPTLYVLELDSHECHPMCRECKFEFDRQDIRVTNGKCFSLHHQICPKRSSWEIKYGYRCILRYDGGDPVFGCRFCGKGNPEDCTCVCSCCGDKRANRIFVDDAECAYCYYLCLKCAKCDICGADWQTSGHERVWEYEKEPICAHCVKKEK